MTNNCNEFFKNIHNIHITLENFGDDICGMLRYLESLDLTKLLVVKAMFATNPERQRLLNYINAEIERKHVLKSERDASRAYYIALLSIILSFITILY